MTRCDRAQDLEAFARRELSAWHAMIVRVHLSSCPSCAREAAWLRTELAVFARRRTDEPSLGGVWRRVEARVGRSAAPRRNVFGGLAAAVALMTAVVTIPRAFDATMSLAGVRGAETIAGFGELASIDPKASLEERYLACLIASPGGNGPCGTLTRVPASFAATFAW